MAMMEIPTPAVAQQAVNEISASWQRRLAAGQLVACPVEYAKAFVESCAVQSCGKCVPCRIGLQQMQVLLDEILDGKATMDTLETLKRLARTVYDSSDCAIGFETGRTVLTSISAFEDDFKHHIECGQCGYEALEYPPCVSACPAHVDIPGYLACIAAGRAQDAVRVIRKDNPLPLACGYICEHPCELSCRRGIVDDALNIRGLKRYAVDSSDNDYTPFHYESTGKTVAVIGGGPSGLTAAYYLALMGHKPTIFEARSHLGGMMRYGIPAYRLPRGLMDSEIDWILKQGVDVKLNTSVPEDISFDDLRKQFDAVYIAIGAHGSKSMGIPGEDAEGVFSAVQMLRAVEEGKSLDFKGKRVAVVGGGNVAMDVARSSVRLGAEKVYIVYRRRAEDITALREELDGALLEGCEFLGLHAPVSIETKDDKVCGITCQKQIPGPIKGGRPTPVAADEAPVTIDVDIVVGAVGQAIEMEPFKSVGLLCGRSFSADKCGAAEGMPGVYVGGDCESGPATVIKAIAAGKAIARNIDEYFGFNHEIELEVEIPAALSGDRQPWGRCQTSERAVAERADDFDLMEIGLSEQEALTEASRCLRCDHFGQGSFRGGRCQKW